MVEQPRDAEERAISALQRLDADDLASLEPPADVWDGIEASIESGRGGLPGSHRSATGGSEDDSVVEYTIDAADRISVVGVGWSGVTAPHVAVETSQPAGGRVLWDAIDGDEMRELWQLVVRKVRSEQVEVRMPFRCDAPHARRWFEMSVTPVADDGVHFRSVLVFAEERSAVALLDPTVDRDRTSPPIELCSWCGRGRLDGSWLAVDRLVAEARLLERVTPPPVSAGICGACREQMSDALERLGASHEAS